MKAAKNSDDKGLDLTIYGDGTNITKDGIIKYLSEKTGGVNHSFASSQTPGGPDVPGTPQQSFFRMNNP